MSYAGATIVVSGSLWSDNTRTGVSTPKEPALLFFCIAALFIATAQLLRYTALHSGAASVVEPITAVKPVFLLVLSFLFNRKIETLRPTVVAGILAAVVGTILLA